MSRGGSGRGGHSGKGGRTRGKGASRIHRGRAHYSSRSTTFMTESRARAIQAHADKTGRNQDFKARAMSAAARHSNTSHSSRGRSYRSSRSSKGGALMTRDRSRAIQAHADKNETNQDFKARAMAAAARNEPE